MLNTLDWFFSIVTMKLDLTGDISRRALALSALFSFGIWIPPMLMKVSVGCNLG